MAFVEDVPPRLRAPLRQLASFAATSLWIPAAVAALVALGTAVGLLVWSPGMDWLPLRLQLTDPAAARAALSAVVTATVAALSLVGTGTIVALQLASGQYSPRLLRDVLTDPGVRWPLAGMVGVVVYALVLLSQLGTDESPTAAVTVGLLAGMAAVGLLVVFIQEVIARIRLESILEEVTAGSLEAVAATYPQDADEVDTDVPDHASALSARRSGYVQAVSLDALVRAAASHRVHVRMRLPVGEFLVRGTTVAWTWPVEDGHGPGPEERDDLAGAVDRALALGVDRTLEGDPAYGLRHLVDVGLRGVSPSVNDPTTTAQCIHQATRVLVALAERPLHDGMAELDGARAVLPRPGMSAHLDLAQSQLLQYGGHDARVVEALAQQLRDLAEATDVDRGLLRRALEELRADDRDRDRLPRDRAVVEDSFGRVEDALGGEADQDEPTAG